MKSTFPQDVPHASAQPTHDVWTPGEAIFTQVRLSSRHTIGLMHMGAAYQLRSFLLVFLVVIA